MNEYWSTLIVGILSALVTIMVAYINSRNTNKKNSGLLESAKAELNFQKKTLGLTDYVRGWKEIEKEIESLSEITPIDRFILFGAWNGEFSPRWTTAHWQYRVGTQERVSYIHTELDEDYSRRIKQMISNGYIILNTSELPLKSLIREIYEVEGITQCVWFHVSNETLNNSKSVAITYCSFATHSGELSKQDIMRCRLVVGRLKEFSNTSN